MYGVGMENMHINVRELRVHMYLDKGSQKIANRSF